MTDTEKVSENTPVTASAKEMSASREKELVEKFNIEHRGGGRYRIKGDEKLYPSKQEALKAAALREIEEEVENELGDIVPEGYRSFELIDRNFVRGSVMELPMNERFLPSGDYNPLYDREWIYAWVYKDRQAIAMNRAKGYRPMEPEEFKREVQDGKIPQFVADLVYDEGSFIVYGDAVLMRCPRYIFTQRRAETSKHNARYLTEQHAVDTGRFRREGINIPDAFIDKLNLENSLEIVEV